MPCAALNLKASDGFVGGGVERNAVAIEGIASDFGELWAAEVL